jgi:FkbM family methyltransferase
MPRFNAREVSVAIPGSPNRVVLRTGNTDAAVFDSIYHRQAYGWDLRMTPRTIIDAGAYTGLSTAFFALRYPNAQIVAIEPDEHNYRLLKKNTAGFANVHTMRAALWGVSGSATLADPGDGAWGFRVDVIQGSPGGGRQSTLGSVPAVTVTDVMREYTIDRIDLLKLDVEGSEKEIFSNSSEWIGRVDAICLELHDRFKAGCSRSFFNAVKEFPIEVWRGEDVLVARDQSRLTQPTGEQTGTRIGPQLSTTATASPLSPPMPAAGISPT